MLRHGLASISQASQTPVGSSLRPVVRLGRPLIARRSHFAPLRALDGESRSCVRSSVRSTNDGRIAGPAKLATITLQPSSLSASALQQQHQLTQLFQISEGLETPIQLIYLLTLLGFLGAGAFLVVRQVLIRRELDEGAKQLGERIRTGEATCEVRLMGEHASYMFRQQF